MRRLILFSFAIGVLFLCMLFLVSCGNEKDDKDPDTGMNGGGNNTGNDTIIVPQYKDYQRGTVNFSEIVYERPDIDGAVEEFDAVSELIKKNEISYTEQLDAIKALEDEYNDILTMSAYANICAYRNTADSYWNGEHEHISTSYPRFSEAVEDLFVSAANSPHALSFENDYFGDSLIEQYKDGGIYTDALVALMEDEARLESEYLALSTASVTITYEGRADTVDSILTLYKETHGENSSVYKEAEEKCLALYDEKLNELSADILVELIKIRSQISEELKYDSYANFAYQNIYHDYSTDDFEEFAEDIADYILPVYVKLSNYIFTQYNPTKSPKVEKAELINNTYKMLEKADDELYDIFSYMLQYSLYDVESSSPDRYNGSFTTYLDSYNAPFLFLSTTGNISDYTTICHEFGHFADGFLNYSAETSLDLSEVSSQALEMLAITSFKGILSDSIIDSLVLYEMENALSTLIFQGFYATFEHIAYKIPYEEISMESLNEAVRLAANKIGLNDSIVNDISYVLIPHILIYPFYVQSYCTAAAVSLEIYFTELDFAGSGFEIYKDLIYREDSDLEFENYLLKAGLTSPFSDDYLKYIADRIHYELLGSHYFKNNVNSDNAA